MRVGIYTTEPKYVKNTTFFTVPPTIAANTSIMALSGPFFFLWQEEVLPTMAWEVAPIPTTTKMHLVVFTYTYWTGPSNTKIYDLTLGQLRMPARHVLAISNAATQLSVYIPTPYLYRYIAFGIYFPKLSMYSIPVIHPGSRCFLLFQYLVFMYTFDFRTRIICILIHFICVNLLPQCKWRAVENPI
jgi:hypothetical protein